MASAFAETSQVVSKQLVSCEAVGGKKLEVKWIVFDERATF